MAKFTKTVRPTIDRLDVSSILYAERDRVQQCCLNVAVCLNAIAMYAAQNGGQPPVTLQMAASVVPASETHNYCCPTGGMYTYAAVLDSETPAIICANHRGVAIKGYCIATKPAGSAQPGSGEAQTSSSPAGYTGVIEIVRVPPKPGELDP